MPIEVTLRVVGIQFQKKVIVNVANPKIKDVLEAARGGDEDFNYVTAPDGTLYQASARVVKDGTESRSSGIRYQAGLYVLTDGVADETSVTTWQWYQIDKNGVQVNQPNKKVEPFLLQSPDIQNGDTIIWRLVTVATAPTIPNNTSSFKNKAEKAKRAAI